MCNFKLKKKKKTTTKIETEREKKYSLFLREKEKKKVDINREKKVFVCDTACAFDIRLYLTPLGQARQFIETCGRKFVYFWASLLFLPR